MVGKVGEVGLAARARPAERAERTTKRERQVKPGGLAAALVNAPAGAVLRLLPGTHEGPFVVRRDVTLLGSGPGITFLTSKRSPVVVFSGAGKVHLRALTVRTDRHALVARQSDVELRGVELQAGGVALSASDSVVKLEDVSVICTGPANDAERSHAMTVNDGRLEVLNVAVTGHCARGVQASRSAVRIQGLVVSGASRAALHLLDSHTEFDDLVLHLERGADSPALFLARTAITGTDFTATGGDHGVLARAGTMTLRRVRIEHVSRSGIALVGVNASLAEVSLNGPFIDGGVVATDAPGLALQEVTVTNAGQSGVLVVRTPLEILGGAISGARSDDIDQFGHGVMVQEASARLTNLSVSDSDGAAIYVSGISSVDADGVVASSSGAGIVVTHLARVKARGLTVNAGTPMGVFATEGAKVTLDDSLLASSKVGSMACQGASIERSPTVKVEAPDVSGSCWFGGDWRQRAK